VPSRWKRAGQALRAISDANRFHPDVEDGAHARVRTVAAELSLQMVTQLIDRTPPQRSPRAAGSALWAASRRPWAVIIAWPAAGHTSRENAPPLRIELREHVVEQKQRLEPAAGR